MQFQIPQFIETEDKIVGPFSLKQFIYMVSCGGTAVLLYFVLNPFIWFIIGMPLFALGVAFAFVKINGQPFSHIVTSAARYYWRPQIYVWQPHHPTMQKRESLSSSPAASVSLEKIVSGIALKSAWQQVQTGSKTGPAEAAKRSFEQMRERYEVFHRITGERHAAKRVDYR
jgi:hypothetical protein